MLVCLVGSPVASLDPRVAFGRVYPHLTPTTPSHPLFCHVVSCCVFPSLVHPDGPKAKKPAVKPLYTKKFVSAERELLFADAFLTACDFVVALQSQMIDKWNQAKATLKDGSESPSDYARPPP